MNNYLQPITSNRFIVFVLLLTCLQAAYIAGTRQSLQFNQQQITAAIQNKITSDAPTLSYVLLQNNEQAAPSLFSDYIYQLNQELSRNEALLRITSITVLAQEQHAIPLRFEGQVIGYINTQKLTPKGSLYLSIWPWISALLLTTVIGWFMTKPKTTAVSENTTKPPMTIPDVWLQIDLKEKKIRNVATGSEVYVANKPLCFYCALIDFCAEYPETFLNPNKDLPAEFLSAANKYFSRLMDLGHTIRKRPNFSNNVEKTLSEIRAAIDEVFPNELNKKAIFSPPKAIGEGSRSKAHNVCLQQINLEKISFIGK